MILKKMKQSNQDMMVNGANPSNIWGQMMDYLGRLSKSMNKTYIQRTRANKPITWTELDNINKKLHHDLDIIVAGDKNVTDNTAPQYETIENRENLTESHLQRIITETVKKAIKKTIIQ